MIDEILRWARTHPSVAAVVRTGSRAAGGPVDALSDHDLVLFVDDPAALEGDDGWFREPGPVMVWIPERGVLLGRRVSARLVIYEDGTKVDFTLAPAELLGELAGLPHLPPWLDAGYQVLQDRDGAAADLPPASGRGYVPERPPPSRCEARLREFWWETTYVARNLARGGLLAARYSLDVVIRHDLLRELLEWHVQGERWRTPVGAVGRRLPDLLEADERRELLASLEDGGLQETGAALRRTIALHRRVGRVVAGRLGLPYPETIAEEVSRYVEEMLASGES